MNQNKQTMTTENQTNLPSEKNKKRKAGEELHISEDESDSSFPRFLVIASKDATPIKYSIFAVQKFIQCGVGEVKEAKKLRNGTVLLEVKTKQQATKALDMTVWFDTEITVTPHRSLNTCRGVIRCRDLRECDDAEVLSGLASQGVTALKHIMRRNGDITEPTNTFILTFSAPTPPKFVRAAYMRIPVELFVPNPLRCFKCQRYGHGRSSCQRPAVCARCGSGEHEDTDCHATPHCTNCGGSHTSYSKECPEWSKQKAITQVKFERNISFGEAKEIVQKQYVSGHAALSGDSVSYAKATASTLKVPSKRSTQTIEIQTDLTWPINSDMPFLHLSSTALPPAALVTAAAQTDVMDASAMGAVGGRPPSPVATGSHLKTTASLKKPTQISPGDKAKPGPASSKGPEKSMTKTSISNRPPKGSGDIVKLSNKFSSLDEMAMELGGASSISPHKSKNK